MHFRSIKNAVALPLHRFGYLIAGLPNGMGRVVLRGIGAMAKAGYFVPGSHLRRTVGNFCHVTGQSDPWRIYSRMIDNVEEAALHYAKLYRDGRSALVDQTVIDPTLEAEGRRLGKGERGLIILVPHCIGAVLSSARLNTFSQTVLLVREPKAPERSQLMLEYVRKLGPEFILARKTPPATVMRSMVRALRENKVLVGTTDMVNPGADTLETRAFGQRIYSPAWPARLSARLGAPILPGYIHMDGSQIRLIADEGYLETDLQKSTQRWVSSFERRFRQFPSDWAFMLDKHWARVLAAESASIREGSARHTESRPRQTPGSMMRQPAE